VEIEALLFTTEARRHGEQQRHESTGWRQQKSSEVKRSKMQRIKAILLSQWFHWESAI